MGQNVLRHTVTRSLAPRNSNGPLAVSFNWKLKFTNILRNHWCRDIWEFIKNWIPLQNDHETRQLNWYLLFDIFLSFWLIEKKKRTFVLSRWTCCLLSCQAINSHFWNNSHESEANNNLLHYIDSFYRFWQGLVESV